MSATIRRAGSRTVHGAASVATTTMGVVATLFISTSHALRWGFLNLGRLLQWTFLTTWRALQWSFFATRQLLLWTFHFLRVSWQWSTFVVVTAALLLRQGAGITLEWVQVGIEWCLYLLSEMMNLLKKGVWHLMEATKQIAWFVADVVQQGFFFLADVVQQIVWTLSDWIRGAFTFSTSESHAETEDDAHTGDLPLLEGQHANRLEPDLDLDHALLAKGRREWEGAHFESAKMSSLDHEERDVPKEALEDQAGALRMRLSTDPYHP
ncbi:MAG: hypothetical protein HQL66_14020 [Magnetococcales bacterium]|nr:hypothetical protein [Magnetococcales bacterium]